MTPKNSWSKYEIVHSLVEFYLNPTMESDSEDVDSSKKIVLNRRRYLNVLFSDTIRPHVALKGKSLSKDDLTAGLKTDQELHMLISEEYNTPNVALYSGNAFPLLKLGRNCDASVFDEITWQKSLQLFKHLSNEYDKCFHNWKLSGHHGDFPDEVGVIAGSVKLPFEKFVMGNNSLTYMHEYVFQFPEVLSSITG